MGRLVFFGQVMSPHQSDQMSERSQVPRIAPLGYSLIEVHSRDHDKAMYEHSSSMIKPLSCMSIAHT